MITSFSNPLVKRIKRLRQKKYRLKEGVFFVEGVRAVLTAVESQASIDTLIICDELLTSITAQQALAQTDIPVTELSRAVFESISERQNPVGIAAIIQTNWTDLDALVIEANSVFVALFEPSDPGNLGTILRTADAVGVSGIILVGQGVGPFHKTAVKASMGTLFTVPICKVADFGQLENWLGTHQMGTIATSAKATTHFRQAVYDKPALLMMGNEQRGLPDGVGQRADQQVMIPMRGTASSLNVATATAVLLYEICAE